MCPCPVVTALVCVVCRNVVARRLVSAMRRVTRRSLNHRQQPTTTTIRWTVTMTMTLTKTQTGCQAWHQADQLSGAGYHSLTHSLLLLITRKISVERQLLLSLMIFLLIYTLLNSWLLLDFFSESHLPDTNYTLSALCVLSWLCLVLFSSAIKQFFL